jgi:hypothetical protein
MWTLFSQKPSTGSRAVTFVYISMSKLCIPLLSGIAMMLVVDFIELRRELIYRRDRGFRV